ncbi:hypothetical protein ACFV9D_24740 [Streptomyces sp. NPDC059875]|uniref:hypothetical protein n=1 Tax=unclassified Streptomyces TaxID=2593676 RepID=UPI00364B3F71
MITHSMAKGMWAAGVAAAAVVILTGCAMFTGDGDDGPKTPAKGGASVSASASASPSPSYAVPDDWTEPKLWAALPRGERTDSRGSQVGFPHTAEGAVAMLAAANTTAIEGQQTNVDEQLRLYYSYVATADQTPEKAERLELKAIETDKKIAKSMSVTPGNVLPSGAYVRSHVVGFKIIKKSADEVAVWLLTRGTQKNGETEKESGSYARSVMGAQWQDGDWKLTGDAALRAAQQASGETKPAMVAPGDAEFNSAGWTAIREAS